MQHLSLLYDSDDGKCAAFVVSSIEYNTIVLVHLFHISFA